ncbi:MAG TPA: chemotaxis protein CheD [Arcobacter sp.]|nr:chemotaxis protein CheD [Arcobacter sp.]HIP56374.1 chemotaxis protein CheD [Arcobacter sp.]
MVTLGHKDGSIEKVSLARITQVVKGYKTHTIIGGEFAVVKDDENIAFKTLLGSCVAIMFYDKSANIKGMNHFLLPATSNSNEDMKYGLYSVEAMLNEMYKMGCRKENMAVKISGGGDIVNVNLSGKSIGQRNVEFAMDFCSSEGFRIISNHTRGTEGRVILLANTFETFIKSVNNSNTTSNVIAEEKKLQREISVRKPAISEYVSSTGIFELDEKAEEEMEITLF